jgi:putative ABC transport system permease protein
VNGLWQDTRYAVRGMLRRPTFAAVIAVTLALGIGANATMFSVINSVLFRPLPYDDPEGIVFVWEQNYLRGVVTNVASPANYIAWEEQNGVFSDIGAIAQFSATITGERGPERIGVVELSPSILDMLGIRPVLGRLLLPADEAPDAAGTVLLSYGFWQRRFGADPTVIERAVTINGSPAQVVGVLPRGFKFDLPWTFNSTGSQDVWTPMQPDEEWRTERGRWLQVLARLAPGVSLERAQNQMTTLAQRLEQEFPRYQTGWTVNVVPLTNQLVGEVRTPLFVLLGAVGLVLLIACANVANLLLARATGRQREIAVRAALGASRGRVVRQLLTESTLLAVAGGILGLAFAYAAVQGLSALNPQELPRVDELGVGGLAVAFTLVLSLFTGLLFGALPAFRISQMDIGQSVAQGGVRGDTGLRQNRARGALVVVEFALSMILLVGAGLLIRSFTRMLDVGVGFDTDNIVTAQVSLPSRAYPEPARRVQLFDDLVERVRALPEVTTASAITFMPLAGAGSATSFWVNDRPIPPDGEKPVADLRWVHWDYHDALGVPLISGRYFGSQDTDDTQLSVIINEWAARHFWPDENPIGKMISMPWGDTLVARVIGVVGNVRHNGPTGQERTKLYWSYHQFLSFNQVTIFARSEGDQAALAGGMRRALAELDPDLPLYNVRSMDSYLADALAQSRFSMLALTLFAIIAIVLAGVGIYGVMSYSVSERTREIGIRMALGASARAVTRRVVLQGTALTAIAAAIGLAGSLLVTRVLQGMVFEVSTSDPLTLLSVTVVLGGVAVVASYVPARRASTVDPVEALRRE